MADHTKSLIQLLKGLGEGAEVEVDGKKIKSGVFGVLVNERPIEGLPISEVLDLIGKLRTAPSDRYLNPKTNPFIPVDLVDDEEPKE